MFEMIGKYTSAKVMIDNVEESCVGQITLFLNHPAFTNPISIMPDCHAGKGAVIGFTMRMTDQIIPNIVAVDIGCGMLSLNIGRVGIDDHDEADAVIRNIIPFGASVHQRQSYNMAKDFPWKEVNETARQFFMKYSEEFNIKVNIPTYNLEWIINKCAQVGMSYERFVKSIGTLGGGNHFIEIGKSSVTKDKWLTVHTGSRNFGKQICEFWQKVAFDNMHNKKDVELQLKIAEIKLKYPSNEIQDRIKTEKDILGYGIQTNGLEWLEGVDAVGYLTDMIFAQAYSKVNRHEIIDIICNNLNWDGTDSVESIHNFIDFNDFIIRKGAIRSYENERMIIPFNMRDGMLICKGLSNPDWNFSAPHGAGRVLSRSKAKDVLNLDNFKKQMKNVFSTSVGSSTLDEAPDAYKDPEIIKEAIQPTCEIIDQIIPIHNLKDGSSAKPRGKKR
jgi:tRNA-splicing ligase RtcB